MLSNLGDTYRRMGRLVEAEEHLRAALEIARESGYRYGEGHRLASLGECLRDKGDVDQARRCLQEAIAILEEVKSPEVEEARALLAALEGRRV